MSIQNNLTIITGNAKQCKAQICVKASQILQFVMKKNIIIQ
jgi:hypothetical protein